MKINNLKIYKKSLLLKNISLYKRCVIVVDMINGFVTEGVLHDNKIANVIPRQIEIINEALSEENTLVVFIKDCHSINATEFKRFGNTTHAVKGTKEAELVDELREYEGRKNVISIEKNSTSFMESPSFRRFIKKAKNINRFDIVGCCTDICDFNGSMGLANYCDEWNRNVEIYLHQDAVATYSEEERQQYVEAAYLLMEQQGIKLVRKK